MSTPLQKQVHKKIKELEAKVTTLWGKENVPSNFTVTFDLTSRRAVGLVNISLFGKTMKLNPQLLEEFGTLYINEVVVHEYAHLVVHELFPNGRNSYKKVQSHGKEFKSVCSHFGIVGRSTTDLFKDSKAILNPNATIKYNCKCTDHMVTPHMHRKIQSGATYRCKLCKTELKYSTERKAA